MLELEPPPARPATRATAPQVEVGTHPPDAPEAELLDELAGRIDVNNLGDLSEEDIADILELAFGVTADFRGPHWEMSAGSAATKRVAKWAKKSVDRWGKIPDWFLKWWELIVAAALLGLQLRSRIAIDIENKKRLGAGGERMNVLLLFVKPPEEGAADATVTLWLYREGLAAPERRGILSLPLSLVAQARGCQALIDELAPLFAVEVHWGGAPPEPVEVPQLAGIGKLVKPLMRMLPRIA